MRWSAALFLPVLGIVGLGFAGADEPVGRSPQTVPQVARFAAPQRPTAPYRAIAAAVPEVSCDADRVDHLRQAAEHLQAAGLNSLADHIRGLADTPSGGKPLQAGSVNVASAQMVLLRIKFLELNGKDLGRLGLDFSQTQIVPGRPGLGGLLEDLRTQGLVRVLAEPTLATVIGRRVRFHTGGEVKLWGIGPDGVPVQRTEPYGTSVDFVPHLIDKRDLRIELRVEVSEVDRTKTIYVAGKENPAIRKRFVETALNMKAGETSALLSGLVPTVDDGRIESASPVLVMLVTTELPEPMASEQSSERLRR